MLDALLEGKTPPAEIAQLARAGARKKVAEIAAALQGHQLNEHHRRMIHYSLEHLKCLEGQVEKLDRDIEEQIRAAGLERHGGVAERTGNSGPEAATILAETGPDMTPFPSTRQFSSWAGVCPGNNRSADKNHGSRTTSGNPWWRSAVTECAWAAAARKNCFLKEKFWRIVSKSSGKKKAALIAVAHNVLVLIHGVLQTLEPYQERNPLAMSDEQKQRLIRHHFRRLGKLGVAIPRYLAAPRHQSSAVPAERC